LPDSMISGKESVELKFQAAAGNTSGGVFNVRILRKTHMN